MNSRKEICIEKFPPIEIAGKIIKLEFFPEKPLIDGPVYLVEWIKRKIKERPGFFIWSDPKKEIEEEKYYNVILYPRKDGKFTDDSYFCEGCFLSRETEQITLDNSTHAVKLSEKKVDLGFSAKAEILIRVPEIRLYFENSSDDDNYWYYYFRTNQEVFKFIKELKKLGYIESGKDIFYTEELESGYANIIESKELENYFESKIKECSDDK